VPELKSDWIRLKKNLTQLHKFYESGVPIVNYTDLTIE